MWGQAEKRLGVTLSCQLVLSANTRVMQRKIKGKSEIQEILALSFVNGGIVSVCERCCRLGALIFSCLTLFTSQVHVASTQCQAGLYLRHLNRGCCGPRCRLQAKLWLRRW